MGVLLIGYLAFLIFRRSEQFSPWLDGWLVVGFELTASALCIARGFGRSSHRRVALVMGGACFSWATGDMVLTLESLGGATPPNPSLADAFYLGFFPIALVAVVLFVRGEIKRGDRPNWLDGAIAALGMAALCTGFAFHGLEHLFQGASLGAATKIAYPVGDLLLLGIVAGSSVVVTARARATLGLIATGLAINATGDTFNFVGGGSHLGFVLNGAAWPASLLVFAMSMWVGKGGSGRLAWEKLSGFVLPGFVTCSSLVILVVGNADHLGPIAVGLATVTLVLSGFRLAFRPALRLAQERLASSEQRYRLLFERNPLPMVAYVRETLQIVAVSDAMLKSYGYTQDECLSMTIPQLLPPEDVPWLFAFLATNPSGSRPELAAQAHYPRRHVHKDGTIIDVEVTSDNVNLDGRECRIAFFQDVTERNRAATELAIARDQAVEASNMKSAFLANVSHEIRTPMNGVLGMTELLLDMGLTEAQRECAEQVTRSGEQMLSLINDILDISKIETGHLELELADFELDETVKETCSVAGALARAKGLRLDLEIGAGVPPRVRGDGRRLGQILLNLVSNAVKFTATGAITVRVHAQPGPQASTAIRVEVADSGIGIDPANLERMFEPFTQADVSTTRQYGGTGLGLAIARELVELMSGTIGAESEPGRGSTFWFEVVLAAAEASAQVPAASPEANPGGAAPSWLNPPLVLVAEDSQINQIVAARSLERCGCRVEVVGDGREALKALEARRYDAVLMDCQMPDMDGYQATAELRRSEAGARRTPVIAMTAHAMDGDRKRCLDAGMDDYISKPMRHTALVAALMRWIPSEPDESLQTAADADDSANADAATDSAASPGIAITAAVRR
jgi:PAS domain S-box-containing protein